MNLYAYKAIDADGRTRSGLSQADHPADLEIRLKRLGLDLIHGKPAHSGILGGPRLSRRQLIDFCFHLEHLSGAGVPLLEALAELRDHADEPRPRAVAAALIASIEGGNTLSRAMAEQPACFDPVFVNSIGAGETSGRLQEVLRSLEQSIKWQDELAAQTRRLLAYPLFTGAIVLAVTLFATLYLVPRLAGFLTHLGQQLPIHTQALLWLSNRVSRYWPWLLGLPGLLLGGMLILLRTSESARQRFDAVKLRLPLIGDILHKIVLLRFARSFAMMYASGISVLDALRTGEGIVGNRAIGQSLADAGNRIAQGWGIAAAFQHTGLFPPLVIRMLRAGETTGALDIALTNVGYFYQRDIRESIGRLQAMLEPALTLFIGLVLGWVMLAVLGPLYDSVARLKL